MGLIWDLIQHGQISEARNRTASVEQRLDMLEADLHKTNETLVSLLRALEQRFGEDLNRDGRIG
jgi:hypothetical protein